MCKECLGSFCKNCIDELGKDIENHLKEGCIENRNMSKLFDTIYRKEKLRKLSPGEIKKLSDENTKVNHISSK